MAGPKNTVAWHRNPLIRGIIAQAVLIAVVVWGITTIYANTVANMEARGIQIGFDFLSEVAPFGIAFSPFIDFNLGESTYLTVFFIGIQNTIIVSILGIIAATILGFAIGIMRLSPNWFISKIATFYIETFRNIPVLLQMMFWNFAIFLPLLPLPRQSLGGGGFFLNNRGVYLPKPVIENASANTAFWLAIAIGIAAMYILHKIALKRQEQTGKTMPGKLVGFGLLAALVALAAMIFGAPFGFSTPVLGTFNLTGGIEIPLPLFSLWFSLTTYTAAFIAENVRGGIEAVTKGQWEAAGALGLSRSNLLNLVVIPQAMRIIVPPTISQYLNLTKNSSLATAIAYEDIVALWTGTSLNQTGQALIIVAMTVVVYELLSLLTSIALNIYNKRVQLVER
ncbi:MAG: ABC transporter permease subunit [bacterium]|nr:ABC transporter permease subunit [bacterium]